MTPKRSFFLRAALTLACTSPVLAQVSDLGGPFIDFSGGPQWRRKATDSAGQTTFKSGYVVNGSVGYRSQVHRVAAEFSFFNNRCKTTDPAGPLIGKERSSGDVDIDAVTGNYAFDLRLDERFTTYIGGGLGTYRVSINGLTTPSLRALPPAYGGPVIVYAKSSWTTVYQVRGGLKVRLNPRSDVTLGYRFFQGSDLDIKLADGSTIHPDAVLHAIEAGVHLKF